MLNHPKGKKEKGGLASMNDKEIEQQINDIIEGEIQNSINNIWNNRKRVREKIVDWDLLTMKVVN